MADSDSNIVEDAPPEWEGRTSELLCPLCKYNLRGLTTPRCPECGFAFRWNELIEAEKNKHKYLFEHAKGLGFKSFWKTYWRTSWPRRFWSDLNPAQPVRMFRLILYWLVVSGIAGLMVAPFADRDSLSYALEDFDAPPWQPEFWHTLFSSAFWSDVGWCFRHERLLASSICTLLMPALWPWITLLSLVVFRLSMRQAKIRTVHVLRSCVYACDFGLLFFISDAVMNFTVRTEDGWWLLAVALICALITTYRLTIAFRQYLRVHLPFATVLASQIIALLIVFLLLVQIADFSRRV
jgi:hypothetical protein